MIIPCCAWLLDFKKEAVEINSKEQWVMPYLAAQASPFLPLRLTAREREGGDCTQTNNFVPHSTKTHAIMDWLILISRGEVDFAEVGEA
jgi:hypothetical protein